MDRRIKATQKDKNGNIIAFGNPGETWSPRSKEDVLRDIKGMRRSYYVQEVQQKKYIRIAPGNALQTTLDKSHKNNLDNLPSL
jgi:hypothetical protein